MDKIKVILAESDMNVMGDLTSLIGRDENICLAGTAKNGIEAWEMITTMQPDLIIMELLMPYMDGFALMDKINNEVPMNKKPKIIITSTISNQSIVRESFMLGANYFMVKPYHMDSVTKRIKQMFTYEMESNVFSEISLEPNNIVAQYLSKAGMPASLKGYEYIVTAVEEVTKDSSMLYGITKILYPYIAKKHSTTNIRVEKAIRHAIEVTWTRSNQENRAKYMGAVNSENDKRPTNSEFIALIAQKIKSGI